MLEKSQVWGADSTGRLTEELGGLHTGLHCMDILSKPPGLEPGDTLVWQCHQQQDWKDRKWQGTDLGEQGRAGRYQVN